MDKDIILEILELNKDMLFYSNDMVKMNEVKNRINELIDKYKNK